MGEGRVQQYNPVARARRRFIQETLCIAKHKSSNYAFRREMRRTEGFQRYTVVVRSLPETFAARRPPTVGHCSTTTTTVPTSTGLDQTQTRTMTNRSYFQSVHRAVNAPREPNKTAAEGIHRPHLLVVPPSGVTSIVNGELAPAPPTNPAPTSGTILKTRPSCPATVTTHSSGLVDARKIMWQQNGERHWAKG